jgi:hypothetical protein
MVLSDVAVFIEVVESENSFGKIDGGGVEFRTDAKISYDSSQLHVVKFQWRFVPKSAREQGIVKHRVSPGIGVVHGQENADTRITFVQEKVRTQPLIRICVDSIDETSI